MFDTHMHKKLTTVRILYLTDLPIRRGGLLIQPRLIKLRLILDGLAYGNTATVRK